jgi:serine/threonine protein phosphatase 1
LNLLSLEPATASRVYAVGDVHGRLDLLLSLEAAIESDLMAYPTPDPLICYLGDYVDRGPDSAGVIEYLSTAGREQFQRVFLLGNHEERMLKFLDAPGANGPGWLKFGGEAALASYGVTHSAADQDFAACREALRRALPETHLQFLRNLELALRWEDFLLVHAGVRPGRSLEDQEPHDLVWIREPFQSSEDDFGVRIVHGHVVTEAPVLRPNRIGLDTGAYGSGVLTGAALELGGAVRLLQAFEVPPIGP